MYYSCLFLFLIFCTTLCPALVTIPSGWGCKRRARARTAAQVRAQGARPWNNGRLPYREGGANVGRSGGAGFSREELETLSGYNGLEQQIPRNVIACTEVISVPPGDSGSQQIDSHFLFIVATIVVSA